MTRQEILKSPVYKSLKAKIENAMRESEQGNFGALDQATSALENWLKTVREV